MQTPRILLLVMSCNQEFFNSAAEVTLNTWLKSCIDYSNITYYVYSGGFDKPAIKNSIVECISKDDLDNTFVKTVECLKLVDAKRYDYVVRTNTSTFINIDMLNKYLTDKFNSQDKDKLCCGDIAILRDTLQLRGNSIIIPKWFTSKIINFDISSIPDNLENTHDDVMISYIFQCNFDKKLFEIIKNDIDFVPCIYLNDTARDGHPLAIFDNKYNLNKVVDKTIFIAYRKNIGDRYMEFGECYKLYNISKHITNDYSVFPIYNTMKIIWLYDSSQFVTF